MHRVRRLGRWILVIAMAVLAVDAVMVAFYGGAAIRLFQWELRSTTIEFPVIAFVAAGILALCVAGKWREAILVCVALIVGGAVGELILRLVDHPLSRAHVDYAAWYQPSAHYGHELVPDFEGFGPLNVPVKINVEGFRDSVHAEEKPPSVVRVLGLGDSFLFGWGVQADETFLKQLERRLQGRFERPVETINTGVPGWGLNQYYLFLKRKGIRFSPDVVVIAYFVDDLSAPVEDKIPPATQYEKGLQFKGSMLHHSRLFNFLTSIGHLVREQNRSARVGYLHDLDVRRAEWSHRANYLMAETTPSEQEQYSRMLTEHVKRLNVLVHTIEAGMAVMYVPDIAQVHHPEAQLINRILRRICQDRSIPFVDMTPVFEQSADLGRYYLWPKDAHLNALGHVEMAAALEQLICGMPELKPPCRNSGVALVR